MYSPYQLTKWQLLSTNMFLQSFFEVSVSAGFLNNRVALFILLFVLHHSETREFLIELQVVSAKKT